MVVGTASRVAIRVVPFNTELLVGKRTGPLKGPSICPGGVPGYRLIAHAESVRLSGAAPLVGCCCAARYSGEGAQLQESVMTFVCGSILVMVVKVPAADCVVV